MTLAEIVEEGEKYLAKYDEIGPARKTLYPVMMCDADVVRRLLAVAKAAVEAERLAAIFRRDYITAPPDADSTAWTQRAWVASGEADDAIEKLFAAVRGDAATGEGR